MAAEVRAVIEAMLHPLDALRAEKERLEAEVKELQQGALAERLQAEHIQVLRDIDVLKSKKGVLFEKSLCDKMKEMLPEMQPKHTGDNKSSSVGDVLLKGDVDIGQLRISVECKNVQKVYEKSLVEQAEGGRINSHAHGALVVVAGAPQKLQSFNSYGSQYIVLCGKQDWLGGLLLLATRLSLKPTPIAADTVDMLHHVENVLKLVVQPCAEQLWMRKTYNDVITKAVGTLNDLHRVLIGADPNCSLAWYIKDNVKNWASKQIAAEKRKLCYSDAPMPKKKDNKK